MGETGEAVRVPDAAGGRPAGGLAARFALSRRGATALEYGLIAGLIAGAIIVALMAVSGSIQTNLYTAIAAAVTPGS